MSPSLGIDSDREAQTRSVSRSSFEHAGVSDGTITSAFNEEEKEYASRLGKRTSVASKSRGRRTINVLEIVRRVATRQL